MTIFNDLKASEQSRIMREFLKKQRWYRGLLESEKDRRNIKDFGQQQYISRLQTHTDIMSFAMHDLELIELYVIEQSYYESVKHGSIAKRLNMNTSEVGKISRKALKKIRINLCNLGVGVTNKDNLEKGMF